MDEFLERRRVPIIIFLLLVIAGGVTVLLAEWPKASGGGQRSALPGRFAQPTLPAIRTVERQVKVFVSGGVVSPGVYTFSDGDRVEDALRAAGGPTSDADVNRLNLAQRLRDEGQIVVPLKSDTPVPGSASGSQTGKVNINTATKGQLEALPGIGTTYAQRIADHRAKNGPFQKTTDLVERKLIPQSTFDKIKDLIDVL